MSLFGTQISERIDPVAQLISDAGGTVVGRTRLQKTAFILSLAGYDVPYHFEYKHYGPFSDQLADTLEIGAAFGKFVEEHKTANWGGSYYLYTGSSVPQSDDQVKVRLTKAAASADQVVLELAATAAYLFVNGYGSDAWDETARRKPDKIIDGKLAAAKKLYEQLAAFQTPRALPQILG